MAGALCLPDAVTAAWSAPEVIRTGSLRLAVAAAKLGRRCTKPAAEGTVEVRDLCEAAALGDIGDLDAVIARIRQHGARPLQPELQDPRRQAQPRLLQQVLDVARRDAELARDILRGEGRIAEARLDLHENLAQARAAQPAHAGDLALLP